MKQSTGMVAATVTAVLVLGAVGALGFTAYQSGVFNTDSAPAATSAPTVDPAVYDFSTVLPGEPLTAAQLEAVDASLSNTAGAYQMADGTFVLVNPSGPLPESIREDAAAKLISPPQTSYSDEASNADFDRIDSTLLQLERTRRNVIVVAQAHGYTYSEQFGGLWNAFKPGGLNILPDSTFDKEAAVTAAETFVNRQTNPERWDIVVAP